MALLTLDECMTKGVLSRRVFNRLKRIEKGLVLNGADGSLPQFLNRAYHQDQKTVADLVKELGDLTQLTTSHGRLREYMVLMGIPILSRSEALSAQRNPNWNNRAESNPLTGTSLSEEAKRRLSDMRRGENNPFYGKTHSAENRVKMANATKGKTWEEMCGVEFALKRKQDLRIRQSGSKCAFYGKRGSQSYTFGKNVSPTLSSTHGGFRRDIGHFVRSTWEANVARVFMMKGEDYQYEPKRFILNITGEYSTLFPGVDKTTYLPDFRSGGSYHEVKGTFDTRGGPQSFAKLLMFLEQHNEQLELIDGVAYKHLEKQFAEAINHDQRFCGWETLKDNLKTNPSKYS